MISIFWWIMLVFVSGLQSQEIGQSQKHNKMGNEKLLNFHHAVNEARQELEDLRAPYDEVLDSATDQRQRRNSIDDMLASFAQDAPKSCNDDAAAAAGSVQDEKALQMAADAWFRDIQASLSKSQSQVQAKESSTGNKQVRAVPAKDHAKTFYNNYEKAMERTEIGKVKLKYKNVPEDTIIMQSERARTPYQEEDSHAATQLDIKLKQVQQLLHDHEEKLERQRLYKSNNNDKVNVKTSESEEKLPQYGDGPIPDGVYEQTLARLNFPHLPLKANNLSHEANYKLSKIEQEASEQASKIPIRYPFKRSSSSNFNPMNEIKLKTSNRLMRKGMGPSLPSNSLTDSRRSLLVDDLIRRRERQMQQRDQREQSQLEEHMDAIMPQQYEAFSNPNFDGSDSMRQTMDSPQSYDYRLPQYEQFHSLNQRTNMRDYSRVKDYERFKREPEGKKTEKLQETDADQTEDTKLESKDQQNHQEKESSEENKVETSVEEHHQDDEKSIETPIKDETKEENKLESSKPDIEIENEAKGENENDSPLHSSKTAIVKNKEDDAMLRLNMKLKVQDPLKSVTASEEALAVAAQPTKVDPCKASQAIKVNSDAVVKLLANEMLQFKNEKERAKRAVRKTRRRHQPLEEQQQPEQEQHRRSKRSVVDLEDHNGNHMHVGSLSNAPLTSDTEDGAKNADEDDGELLNQQLNGIHYDNTRNQVPMLTLRQQQQTYPLVPQQQVQYPQQQHQQQQQQQQQQQPQQQAHQPSNFRASFNLTHFFNELTKLQKIQQPQQQQQQQQQQAKLQHQIYQQQTQSHQQQQQPQQQQQLQQQLQQHAQMNSIPKAIPNENKSILMKQSPVHRYLGPFFNSKQSKSNILNSDPCLTTVEPRLTTINPDCVPITQPSAASSTGENKTTTINGSTPTGSEDAATPSATAATPTDNICNNPDIMKLNVSINANVCGDPKTKQFYGNGSINLQPGYERLNSDHDIEDHFLDKEQDENQTLVDEMNENLDTEERYARQARRHQLKEQKKKKDAKKKTKAKEGHPSSCKESKKCTVQHSDEPSSDSYEKLISGKISEDIVNAVFEAVNNDPSLDRLAGVLERNRKCLQKKPKNFYQIRNDRTDQYLEHTEEMVRQTMEAISDIIDNQVRQRACIPLRPDLMEFYDTIVKTMAEQQKSREKRESTLQTLANDFSQDVRLLDPSKIEKKSRIVKKLLRQYDELPMEDQQSVSNIRDELLMDLIYLRKMADTAERIQRNAQLSQVLKQPSSGKDNKILITGEFTPRFIKLIRTAELFRGAGAEHQQQQQQAKAFIGL